MSENKRQLSLVERWELDIESYKEGAKVNVSIPQCETCTNFIKGNALHCNSYMEERKPKYVMFPHKECPKYCNYNKLCLQKLNNIEEKLYGGLFGFCIGDMLGVPVEFSSRQEREEDKVEELRAYGTYHQPFGTWSDDTSLTLCLLDAINRGYSSKQVADNFISYYQDGYFTPHGEVFDIGNSTRDAIKKMIEGNIPTECGGGSEYDNGNGSLMRILPLAFYGMKLDDKELIAMIEEVSSFTHSHKRSRLACIFYVYYAIQLTQGKEKIEAYDRTREFVKENCTEVYAEEFKNFERILNKECIECTRDQIKSTGYVVDTLEAVLWTFNNSTGYKEIVLNAVNLGGDTDTIAAIAGGLAGIYYGYSNLPDQWIQAVARKKVLAEMFKEFISLLNK